MSWLVMRHIHSAGRLALPDYQNLDMIRLLYQRTYLLLIMFLSDPQELARLEEEEQEYSQPQQIWEGFRKRYPKIQAFDSANGCEILTIKPQDIGLLPRENWNYGNNSFLLHGYYNYRYLVLARIGGEGSQIRYILGVPGHYYSNEKYMASMFGFPHFVLSKKQPSQDGRFGYWYTDIRLQNQD